MALATRNLYLVLKARDEASRVVKGFGRELSRAGDVARADMLRQRAAIMSVENAERSLAAQREVNRLRARAATAAENAALMRSQGAAQADIDMRIRQSRRMRQQASELERENNIINKQSQLATQLLRTEASELDRGHRAALRLSNALHTVSATLVTIGSTAAIAGAGTLVALYRTTQVATEYGRQVALTKTQVTDFKVSLEELSDVGLRVAQNIATPFESIQPALYNIFSSTNANLSQATILLEGFAKTAVAGQVSIEDAARGTIPILNAFNIPLERVNDILDIQFQLVRKGVGTYDEFSKVFGRVVPSATRAGQSFETVAAMLAYMTRNGQSAAMSATSSARALDAFSHPKAVANLEAMGVKVRDLKGNFLPLEQILLSLRDKINKLPPADRVAALVEVFKGAGGTIQARRFIEQVLLRPGELEEYVGFLNDMKHANGAFGEAYGEMSNTVAAQTELMRNKWKVLQVTVGRIVTPVFIVLIGLIQRLLDWFNNLSPKWQRLITLGVAFGGVLAVVAGGLVTFLGLLLGVTAAVMSAGAVFFYLVGGVAAVTAGLALLGAAFVTAYNNSYHFRKLLSDLDKGMRRFWQEVVVPAAKAIKDAFDKDMRPAIDRLVYLWENRVLPVLLVIAQVIIDRVIPATKQIADVVRTFLVKAFEIAAYMIERALIPSIAKLIDYYYKHKETIDLVISYIIFLVKWIGILIAILTGAGLVAAIVMVIGSLIAFVNLMLLIAKIVVHVIDAFRALIDWFKHFGDSSDKTAASVSKSWDKVVAFMKTVPGLIKSALGDLTGLLVDAGEKVIMGLIKGIENKVDSLKNKVKSVAQTVKDFWPFSPAKTGPLSGTGSLYYAGQSLMEQLQKGMESYMPQLSATSSNSAAAVSERLSAPPVTNNRNVTQTIVVNTNELNPRRLSQELGSRLAGVS